MEHVGGHRPLGPMVRGSNKIPNFIKKGSFMLASKTRDEKEVRAKEVGKLVAN